MLFIHGGNDDYVPTSHVYDKHNATAGYKEMWIAPGSEHARSYRDHPDEYLSRVGSFLNKVKTENL